jgi:F-type H+-transporting ATPase subunit a
MMPGLIRKTLLLCGIGGALVAVGWSLWDWRAALTFVLAVCWAMANILVWTQLIQQVVVVGPRRPLRVFGWLVAKLALLAGGFAAVWAAAPLSVGQTLGLTIGVFSVLLSATILAFCGAFLDKPAASASPLGDNSTGTPSAGSPMNGAAALVLCVAMACAAAQARANAPVPVASPQELKPDQKTVTVDASAAGKSEAPPAAVITAPADATDVSEVEPVAAEEEGHGGAGREEPAKPELPTLITVILHMQIGGTPVMDTAVGHFLETYEYQVFLVIVTLVLCGIVVGTRGLRAIMPGPTQAALELIVEGFYNFFAGVLGSRERARHHMPFFGSIFFFVWFNNMFGLIPLFTGATGTYQLTASLAVLVFFYVHYNAIREAGFKHWIMELMQDPKDVMGWVLAPVFFVLHVISELAKPLSLSLRLFGNMTGEHILNGVFLILGLMLMSAVWPHPWVGVPLHLPFLFLSLLVGTIQAMVFMLLSTIYLALFLPQDDHGHDEAGAVQAAH